MLKKKVSLQNNKSVSGFITIHLESDNIERPSFVTGEFKHTTDILIRHKVQSFYPKGRGYEMNEEFIVSDEHIEEVIEEVEHRLILKLKSLDKPVEDKYDFLKEKGFEKT